MRSRALSLFVILAVLAAGCGTKKTEAPRLEAFPVKVQRMSPGTLEDTLTLVGSLKARDEATLYSRVPGKLKENLLREGERVAKDQAVALVERDEVGVKFEPAPVPSTLSGVVGRVYLDRGAHVTLQTPVALVVDDRELIARAEVPERYVGRVRLGQSVGVQVDAWPQDSFRGIVSRVSPVVDPATRSAPIEVRMAGNSKLRSGMFAKMILVVERREGVLTVPVEALQDGGSWWVLVAAGGKAARRDVELGLRTETRAEVRKGLAPGDLLITSGLFGLQDGSPVEVQP